MRSPCQYPVANLPCNYPLPSGANTLYLQWIIGWHLSKSCQMTHAKLLFEQLLLDFWYYIYGSYSAFGLCCGCFCCRTDSYWTKIYHSFTIISGDTIKFTFIFSLKFCLCEHFMLSILLRLAAWLMLPACSYLQCVIIPDGAVQMQSIDL